MIKFSNTSQEIPFLLLKNKYDEALEKGQRAIEAIAISSYNEQKNEVDSRYVNLKFVINEEFIFFSNYDSPKATSFNSHTQIAALLYWSSTNTQIRFKAIIKKTSYEFNQEYFSKRAKEKNALAISSNQSNIVKSYSQVVDKYHRSLKEDNLNICPKHWGGYSFKPFEIEFWEGNDYRLNKRNLYKKSKNTWDHFILEP